ncbi:hypothetical protein ACFU5N_22605 [Streptomyces albidoflavus]
MAAAPAAPLAKAAAGTRAAAPVNLSCTLPKKTQTKTSTKNCRSFSVPRGRTVSVELVSSGGKTLTVGLKNSSGTRLASKRVSPGAGYAVHWTNNASGARTVTLYISDIRLVEVRANLRYRIG